MLVRIRYLFWDSVQTVVEEWGNRTCESTRIGFILEIILLALLLTLGGYLYYIVFGVGVALILNLLGVLDGLVLGDNPLITSMDSKEVNVVFVTVTILLYYLIRLINNTVLYFRSKRKDLLILKYSHFKTLWAIFSEKFCVELRKQRVTYDSYKEYANFSYKENFFMLNYIPFLKVVSDLKKKQIKEQIHERKRSLFKNAQVVRESNLCYKKSQRKNTEALLEVFVSDIEALRKEASNQINEANEMMTDVCENIKEQRRLGLVK